MTNSQSTLENFAGFSIGKMPYRIDDFEFIVEEKGQKEVFHYTIHSKNSLKKLRNRFLPELLLEISKSFLKKKISKDKKS
ncbi:MAG: hypothetical protein GF308_02380 [Candidatus Heimdallarchaeota archaeon]|nr:hypothetical protein [Candidatus Heimdallarchaeota archaeon]